MAHRRHKTPLDRARHAASAQWLYGRHAVEAALANPARICHRLVGLAEASSELATLLAGARAAKLPAAPEILDRRALEMALPQGAVHQGMALAADPLPAPAIEDVLGDLPATPEPHIIILLDQVTDPHNVGAILRSASAFGALALVVPEHGAPPVTGALAKSASGALETVPLIRVINLVRTLEQVKKAGFWCIGLDSAAAQSIEEIERPRRIALTLGAEGAGLRRLTRENCDFLLRLPTRGALASLNVSNAAAVALYALTRHAPVS